LDKCHAKLLSKVDLHLSGATVCLTIDAWSNIKNNFVINYMAVSPTCSLFLESMLTGQQGHDHEFIARDIERVIVHHENTLFTDAVTDNTNANKKAWQLLKARFPSCYFQGWCSHNLHLFVNDVFGVTKTNKRGDTEPMYLDGYPFDDLHDFIKDYNDVVKSFHNHHVLKA
jgi:hypothetical protein